MGVIRIEVAGSFGRGDVREFSALKTGHADAVAQAIEWLSKDLLPHSVRLDHSLHQKGEKPERGFGVRE